MFAALLLAAAVFAKVMTPLQQIALKDINGQPTSLAAHDGKVVLVVNVASECGLTPQYKALEALHQRFKARGFTIVGVPCNDFGGQEPGSNDQIKTFCSTKYNVTFPLLDKVHVKGPEQHPLYAHLTGKEAKFPGDVKWNFGKFLIGADGQVLKRFEPATTPDAAEVIAAIEAALPAK